MRHGPRLLWLAAPVLFAVGSLGSLYASNASELTPADVLPSLGWSVMGVLASTIVLFFLFRDVPRTVFVAGLGATVYFYYGYLYEAVGSPSLRVGRLAVGTDAILLPAVAILLTAFVVFAFRNHERTVLVAKTLTVVGVSLAVTATATAVMAEVSLHRDAIQAQGTQPSDEQASAQGGAVDRAVASPVPYAQAAVKASGIKKEQQPDIFFIVLDGYASSDSIEEFSGFNNADFTSFLRRKGFYIAEDAKANYSTTFLSLAATTNMRYLDDDIRGMSGTNRDRFYGLVKNNRAARKLKAEGYRYIHVASGWGSTNTAPLADKVLKVRGTETDAAFRNTTLVRSFADRGMSKVKHRAIRKAFEHLEGVKSSRSQPTFVFAHILAPHGPYVFNADGTLATGASTDMANWRPEQKDNYVAQLRAINALTERFVAKRLEDRTRPLIVIIQGDHGSNFPAKRLAVRWNRRHSVFSAMYFSQGTPKDLYPSISPVNTFRIVLNEAIGTDYKPLKDWAYHSRNYKDPYELTDVTRAIRDVESTP